MKKKTKIKKEESEVREQLQSDDMEHVEAID